ncbi:MAG: hypothetical protein KF799_15210 [Bdellovibrionales bacterium]|nr:hypothetical protein [Bdellovibrionales bacterium]
MLKWFVLPLTVLSWKAHTMVMPPTTNAAEALGYQVAGEIEFPRRTSTPLRQSLAENLAEIHEMCPRTQLRNSPVRAPVHIVVLAWSDREFPGERDEYTLEDLDLAAQRARRTAAGLRRDLPADTSFELVNMASRRPHKVRVSDRASVRGPVFDVKTALKISGAAPSGRLEVGLFGEYGQSSKAVVWVECFETFTRRPAIPAQKEVRRLASFRPKDRGIFVRTPESKLSPLIL